MDDEFNIKNEGSEKSILKPARLQKLNEYSNLIVGFATVLLVIVTAIYIVLSMKIANETKRLADITVEQFKIKSYPTFLIIRENPTYEKGKYKDQIKIENHGEIASFETSIAIFYVLSLLNDKKEKEVTYVLDWQYVYMDDELGKLSVIDYSSKILPLASKKIQTNRSLSKYVFDSIKYQLIIVRHKVPYDTKYSYEEFAYGLERKKGEKSEQETFRWETLPNIKRENLVEELFEKEIRASEKEEIVRGFFVDYPGQKHLRFYKKNETEG